MSIRCEASPWAALLVVIALMVITAPAIAQDDKEPSAPQVPPRVLPVEGSISAAEQRIYAAFDRTYNGEYIETDFSDVVLNLSERYAIPIVLDTRALDGQGIGTDWPVTFSLKGATFRTALELMLSQFELTWTVRDEVLLLTTHEEAEANQNIRIYSVPDLMRSAPSVYALVPEALDPNGLCETIRIATAHLGNGIGIATHGGNLIITADDQAQLEVQAILNGLRLAKHRHNDLPAAFKEPILLSSRHQGPGFEHVVKVLQEPTALEFIETGLHDVILNLSFRHKIPIFLDQHSLGEVGIGSDTPITQALRGISFGAAINLMLKELELTWVIRGEVLVITTVEKAENESLVLAAHIVRDLADQPGTTTQDYDSLIELIMTSMHPDTWEGGSGPPSDCIAFEPADALLIRQSYQTQREIHDLLTTLRRSPSRAGWRPEQQAEEIEAELRTPVLQTFTVNHGWLTSVSDIDTIRAVEFVEATLSKEALASAKLRSAEDHLSLFMTPIEAAELQRAFLKAGLPVWNTRFHLPPR